MKVSPPKSTFMDSAQSDVSNFPSSAGAAGGASSVWLIEDNATFRLAIRRALENCAEVRQVRTFGRCEDALAALKAGAAPDIVLMDLGLPGMGGLEGIERFKAIVPETAVIVLTMYDDEERISRAISGGAAGYLLKKAASLEIVSAIRDVRAGGTPITAQVARHVLEMYRRLTPTPPNYHDAAGNRGAGTTGARAREEGDRGPPRREYPHRRHASAQHLREAQRE
jgi:DNA-binding NarL/FixJ family response regulator